MKAHKHINKKFAMILSSMMFSAVSFTTSSVAMAESQDQAGGITMGSTGAKQPSDRSQSSQTSTYQTDGGTGSKSAAHDSSAAQDLGKVLQYATGGMQMFIGGIMVKKSCWNAWDAMQCAMGTMMVANGTLQIAQGLENGKASNDSGASACALSNGCSGDGFGGAAPYLPGTATDRDRVFADIDKNPILDETTKTDIRTQLSKGTFDNTGKLNANATKFTGPDGKLHDASSMNSAGDLQAAGFSASQAKAIMDAAKDAQDKVLAKAAKLGLNTNGVNSIDDSGGAGAGLAAGSAGSGDGSGRGAGLGGFRGLGGLGKDGKRDPASLVAGMTKNFNGEPIGVAGDSIFLMMNRRYKLKTSQDMFLNEAELLSPH